VFIQYDLLLQADPSTEPGGKALCNDFSIGHAFFNQAEHLMQSTANIKACDGGFASWGPLCHVMNPLLATQAWFVQLGWFCGWVENLGKVCM